MDIGLAIKYMKQGKKVARTGWNGKDMFLYLVRESEIDTKWFRREAAEQFQGTDGSMKICGHIDMKAADDSIVIGWLASQTDLLAEDWFVVE